LFLFSAHGECCTGYVNECVFYELLRQVDNCDNRSGAGTLSCEREVGSSTNEETWKKNEIIKSYATEHESKAGVEFLYVQFENTFTLGSTKTTEKTYRNARSSSSSSKQPIKITSNPGTNIFHFEILGYCGPAQVSAGVIKFEFTSTVLCQA